MEKLKLKVFIQNFSFIIIHATICIAAVFIFLKILPLFSSDTSKYTGDWIGFAGSIIGAIIGISGVFWQIERQLKETERIKKANDNIKMLVMLYENKREILIYFKKILIILKNQKEHTYSALDFEKNLFGSDVNELTDAIRELANEINENIFLNIFLVNT